MELHHKTNQPCEQCPYKLGLVKTVANPCPQCLLSGYGAFEQFQKQLTGRCESTSGEHR